MDGIQSTGQLLCFVLLPPAEAKKVWGKNICAEEKEYLYKTDKEAVSQVYIITCLFDTEGLVLLQLPLPT